MSAMESLFQSFKLKALGAVRETVMAVEFAEQAQEAIGLGAFQPASDTEIESAENSLATAELHLDDLKTLLLRIKAESEVAA